jgi:hypothetical protein
MVKLIVNSEKNNTKIKIKLFTYEKESSIIFDVSPFCL